MYPVRFRVLALTSTIAICLQLETSRTGTHLLHPVVMADAITRSVLPEHFVFTRVYNGPPKVGLRLWWGPIVDVKPGDEITAFVSCTGQLAFEQVYPAMEH